MRTAPTTGPRTTALSQCQSSGGGPRECDRAFRATRGVLECRPTLGIHDRSGHGWRDVTPDPQGFRLVVTSCEERTARRRRVPYPIHRSRACHGIEQGGGVSDRAGERPVHTEATDLAVKRPRTRPRLVLRPTRPFTLAGIRIEPAPSLPWAAGIRPAATAAPCATARSTGGARHVPWCTCGRVALWLGVTGRSELRRCGLAQADCPAERSFSTTASSIPHSSGGNAPVPKPVGMSAVTQRSLITVGTPCKGGELGALDHHLLGAPGCLGGFVAGR